MTEPSDSPYAGWEQIPEAAPRSRGVRIFLLVTASVSLLLAALYGLAYVLEPKGTDGFNVLLRASVAVAGAALLAIARGVAKNETPRIKGLLSLAATVFVAGLVDAAFLLFNAALDLPDVLRSLSFLFMGLLVGVQVLLLLRKGRSDKDSIPAFFAQHATTVAFLLFLLITRIAMRDLLRSLLPALFLNLIFLISFLGAAVFLIARFLARFGSPVSWTDAKRHEQTVERMSDPRMEEVRGLLQQYIGTGQKLPEYQDMIRSVMKRVEADPGDIEPLLVRAPGPLKPRLPSTPVPILLLASFSIALALGAITTALFWLATPQASVFLLGIITVGVTQPPVSALLRMSGTDPAPGFQYWLSGILALVGAGLLYVAQPAQTLPIGIGVLCALLYLIQAVTRMFRRGGEAPGPDHAYRRAEAAATQTRRARGLLYWGLAFLLAAPLWFAASWLAKRWIDLGSPPGALLTAGLLAGVLFGAAGYLLGPFLASHREEIKGVHKQETGLRQSYHRVLVKKLEGART